MRFLCIFLFLQTVSTIRPRYNFRPFGDVCHEWNCLNEKLDFDNAFKSKEDTVQFFQGLLPPGDWQDVVHTAVNGCYTNRPIHQYSDTCSGQNLMHCVVDKLIRGCPNKSTYDFCTPVTSVTTGRIKYMFSQRRYYNMKDIPKEGPPSFFLRAFFSINCCDLPDMFNQSLLHECGINFLQFIHMGAQLERLGNESYLYLQLPETTTAKLSTEHSLNMDDDGGQCREWNCLNEKLDFDNAFKSKEDTIQFLQGLLPPGNWQSVAHTAVNSCYWNKRIRQYSNCPGQNLIHCVVDKLIRGCPNKNIDDFCAPVISVAGRKYMFSQRRYNNMEKNITREVLPSFFLRNYFSINCCDLPEMFNQSLLNECGMRFIQYNHMEPQLKVLGNESYVQLPETTTPKLSTEHSLNADDDGGQLVDPLDCCQMDDFIQPNWRTECNFKLKWDLFDRLTVRNGTDVVINTTEEPSLKQRDISIVPISCEKEQCIFRNLNIVSDTGVVNEEMFLELLENMAASHPAWANAKGNVIYYCLGRKFDLIYSGDCEINKLLSCTFDVLSENCPERDNNNNCARGKLPEEGEICQISSSKYRPLYRRQYCNIPDLVDGKVLSQCGVSSLFTVKYSVPVVKPKRIPYYSFFSCKELEPTAWCVANKMDILDDDGFVDFYKMKDKVRKYSDCLNSGLYNMYYNALVSPPYYTKQCLSSRRFFGVLDTMLTTCDTSRRKTNERCNKLLIRVNYTISSAEKHKLNQTISIFQNRYFPSSTLPPTTTRKSRIVNNRLFNFGLLGKNEPPVVTIDLKPKEKPLLSPVYQRLPKNDPLAINSLHNDGVWRG